MTQTIVNSSTKTLSESNNKKNNKKQPRPTDNRLIGIYDDAISRLSVEDIYSKYNHEFQGDYSGKLRGIPPFRESFSGTSFTIFPDKGFLDAGDRFAGTPADYIHSLRMGRWEKARGKDWVEATKELCRMASIEFPASYNHLSEADIEQAQKWERRRAVLAAANEYMTGAINSPSGEIAREYLSGRGVNSEAIAELEIGYCDSIKNLYKHLQARGFSASEITSSGVCATKLEGYISAMWRDAQSRPLTIYYRYHQKAAPEGKPKTYALRGASTKQSPLYFDKVLKNQHKEVIFVEGVFDAVILQANGETRVCSGVAAQFSNEQINSLSCHGIRSVWHVGDPDGGGDAGTESNLINLSKKMINVYVPERLPDGLDPDEFIIKYGLKAFQDRLEKSQPGLTWKAQRLIDNANLETTKGKEELIIEAKLWLKKVTGIEERKIKMYFWSQIESYWKDKDLFKDEVSSFDTDVPDWSQSGISRWLANRYRPQLAWHPKLQKWYRYEAEIKGIWSEEQPEFVRQVIATELQYLEGIYRRLEDPKNYSNNFVRGIESLMKDALAVRKWDSADDKLPLLNGVFNLKTRQLEEHSPGNRLTWVLPHSYDPNCTAQPIIDWLNETVGNPQEVELLRAYLAAVVLGRTDLQRYLELIGPGGTGKSTYIRLAMALVGARNTHTTTLQKLEGSRFESACIHNKRLVVITDSERYAGSVSVLKALTGQDPLPFEVKFMQSTEGFIPHAMVIVAANEIIQSGDYTSGLERRRLTCWFSNQVPRDRQRNLIDLKNINEFGGEFFDYIPGLLNWVLALPESDITNYVKRTDEFVPSLTLKKKQVFCDVNPIADWADHHLVLRDRRTYVGRASRDKNHESITSYHFIDTWLYASFCEHAITTGTKPVAVRRFVSLLEDFLINQLKIPIGRGKDKRGSYFEGIAIRQDHDEDPPFVSGDGMVMDGDGMVMAKAKMPSPSETPSGQGFQASRSSLGDSGDGKFKKSGIEQKSTFENLKSDAQRSGEVLKNAITDVTTFSETPTQQGLECGDVKNNLPSPMTSPAITMPSLEQIPLYSSVDIRRGEHWQEGYVVVEVEGQTYKVLAAWDDINIDKPETFTADQVRMTASGFKKSPEENKKILGG